MLSMLGDFESLGGTIVFNTEFVNAIENKCLIVSTKFNNEITKVTCNKIINSAGLFADRWQENYLNIMNQIFQIFHAKGNYFSYTGNSHFESLIYPVPDKHSLGIHLTVDQNNR